ncbi:DUF1573 domain-containing protein [Clostridium sp. Cult1]|uniref:DUF1573 domain-containing protein n=1 Tax=Clostridium sp. Cult1 TaxID=2079002 RepID=UPI001F490C86|nr:DUF1573 domain-containing protein [Clostridium sp. Cult1]MCF6462469.1 DUF1573 domain-containing protein [Clostridium sp. Cult1]
MDRNTVSIDKNVSCDDFQAQVEDVLIRHRSILDIITKLNEYTSRIDRAVVKSVTYCGCIEIHATKQDYNRESLEEIKNNMQNHVKGNLCPSCKEVLEEEIGAYIFYLSALCNALNINLSEAILKEYGNMKTLGIFSLK